MDAETVDRLSRKMVVFLETGTVPDGLFHPDVFLDLSLPTWRVQARGTQDLEQERKDGHPGPSTVTRWRSDPTPPDWSSSSKSGGAAKASSGTPGR